MLPLAAVVLAERCIVAVGRDDWPAAVALSEQALSMVQDGEFDDYWTSALVYAWAARAAIHRGDPAAAREHVIRAARLRPLLTYALPVVSVQALLELARAYLALTDPDGARAVLRQVSDILQQRPDLGVLPDEADELRAKVETIGRQGVGGSSLTTAELRILPLLATHLTFREIAERLYLSPYTVKTQALSVYRKFGVSSRSAAIERAHGVGVLGHRSPSVLPGGATSANEGHDEPQRAEGAWCLSAEASSATPERQDRPAPRPSRAGRWPPRCWPRPSCTSARPTAGGCPAGGCSRWCSWSCSGS